MAMEPILFALAIGLAGPHIPWERSASFAEDVTAVVQSEPSLFDGENGQEKTGRLLTAWAWRESSWKADALGDGGQSVGVMQVNAMFLGGHSKAAVLADRRLGLRLGLRLMIRLKTHCGGLVRGLGAYASGHCGRVRPLVLSRCKEAGVAC